MSDEAAAPSLSADEAAHVHRALSLLDAWRGNKPAIVDGVRFQLQCDVDKEAWTPLSHLGLHGHSVALHGPELIFPWTPPKVRELMAASAEVIDVHPGDVVIAGYVRSAPLRSAFEGVADADQGEGKQVYLFVLRTDGDAVAVKRPLILLPPTATEAYVRVGDYSAVHQSLLARLEARSGLAELEELLDEPIEAWPALRTDLTETYRRALLALLEGSQSYDHEPYVAFGYLMAKAEAEEQLLSVATRGRKAATALARATDGRRAQGRHTRSRLQGLAREIIATDRNISLGRCAKLVEAALSDDPDWPFKSDAKWITRHIRELFEQRGERLEFRPRRDLFVEGTTDG
jgi:hypothetical protein